MIVAYGAVRISQKGATREDKKSDFVGMVPGRYATPETSALDPRSHISSERDMDSAHEVRDQD